MHALRPAALAVSFLTVLPVRLAGEVPELSASAPWFPVVGGLVGAAAGAVRAAVAPLVGAWAAAVLAVLALVWITGALHADGLADCADGLGVRGDRARRLAAMRDSAIGTFGTLALLVWLLLCVAALAGLSAGDAVRALVVAGALSRWAALVHAAVAPPARGDGLGAAFAPTQSAQALAALAAAVIAVVVIGPGPGVAALAVAAAIAGGLGAWARATLGGRTGDTLGASVAVAEAALLLLILGLLAA